MKYQRYTLEILICPLLNTFFHSAGMFVLNAFDLILMKETIRLQNYSKENTIKLLENIDTRYSKYVIPPQLNSSKIANLAVLDMLLKLYFQRDDVSPQALPILFLDTVMISDTISYKN